MRLADVALSPDDERRAVGQWCGMLADNAARAVHGHRSNLSRVLWKSFPVSQRENVTKSGVGPAAEAHAANALFNSWTMAFKSLPKTFDARAKPPSLMNGVRSKLSISISRLVAM